MYNNYIEQMVYIYKKDVQTRWSIVTKGGCPYRAIGYLIQHARTIEAGETCLVAAEDGELVNLGSWNDLTEPSIKLNCHFR